MVEFTRSTTAREVGRGLQPHAVLRLTCDRFRGLVRSPW